MIACYLSNISAKYYKNPSMLSPVIAKNVGDVFWDTVYICFSAIVQHLSVFWGKFVLHMHRNYHFWGSEKVPTSSLDLASKMF